MKRPMLPALLFFLSGIIAAWIMPSGVSLMYVAAFVLIAFVVAAGMIVRTRKFVMAVFPVFTVIGMVLTLNSLSPRDIRAEKASKAGEAVTVSGVVTESREYDDRSYLTVKTRDIAVSADVFETGVKIRVISKTRVEMGDVITVTGVLKPFSFKRNPGGFDPFFYNKCRGIEYSLEAESFEKTGAAFLPEFIFTYARERLSAVFDEALPDGEAGLMKSIVLGDSGSVPEDMAQLYRDAGTYHILVTSGGHLSIIAFCVRGLLRKITTPRNSAVLAFATLALYALLVGGNMPILRALVMWGIMLLADIIGRETDNISSVCVSALILLFIQPLYLFEAGFQFSFAAVIGLMLLTSPIKKLMLELSEKKGLALLGRSFIVEPLAPSIAAAAATTPIIAYHFFEVSTVSVWCNAAISLGSFAVIVLGLVTGAVGLFSISAAKFLSGSLYAILKLYERMFGFITSLPFAKVVTGSPGILMLLACVAIIVGFVFIMGRGKPLRKRPAVVTACIAILLAAADLLSPKPMSVTFLDVGQGDSAVVNLGKITAVIDGGGLFYRKVGDNTGVNVLVPFLRSKGITTVDAVFVSHADTDHAMGVLELVMSEVDVGNVIFPISVDTSAPLYNQIAEAAKSGNIPVYYMRAGDGVTINDIGFSCVYPFEGGFARPNDSLVLKMSYREADFVFGGDISSAMERTIVEKTDFISSEVLKLSHHGSGYSNSVAFLQDVSPELAIVSCGVNNIYGHPAEAVLQRVSEQGALTLTTAENGAITLYTYGNDIYVNTMRDDFLWKRLQL